MIDTSTEIQERLAFILHTAFVDIRNLSYETGHERQINELADMMEILPQYLMQPVEESTVAHIRLMLNEFQQRNANGGRDYAALLDRDDVPRWH